MLRKQQRLRTADFKTCFSSGRRLQGQLLTVVYCPQAMFQVAAVVGKKVAKSAVGRNRQRRRLYAAIRHVRDQETYSGTFIVVAKAGVLSASAAKLRQEIRGLFGRTKKTR